MNIQKIIISINFLEKSFKNGKRNRVYKIPVKVNGVDMDYIFDTEAGLIPISNIEAMNLFKQVKITKDNIIGHENFMDTNGVISVGTIIKPSEFSISNRIIYNTETSVVDNAVATLW